MKEYEAAAIAIAQAEEALKSLSGFSQAQYKEKGRTMVEQVSGYIADVLSDAKYMCCGCVYGDLALSNMGDRFAFYVYDSGPLSTGTPVFSVSPNGDVDHIFELNKNMMLTLVRDWDGFKKELHASIKITLRERTRAINAELAHIGYVNEQLEKWSV